MKYFTRDLLERFGSPEDDVADAAQAEWEAAAEAYREELAATRQYFDPQLLRLLDEVRLHDAQLLLAERFGDLFFVEIVPVRTVRPILLTYDLAPGYPAEMLGEAPRTSDAAVYWLYDELSALSPGLARAFTHTILLSDGREIVIPFSGFRWQELPAVKNLLPVPQ